MRASGCGALKAPHNTDAELGVEHYVEIALLDNPDAILILIDADKECIQRRGREGLGPELLRRSLTVSRGIPVAVVVADREFEAWFIAATERLRASGHFVPAATFAVNTQIEQIASCKGRMLKLLGRTYSPAADQHRLAADLPFTQTMTRRSRSFGKLLRELERLCREARHR